MDSFKTFLINEKVSKREMTTALKDPNIIVGMEYEFIFNDDEIVGDETMAAENAYYDFITDINEAEDNISLRHNSYQIELLGIIDDTIDIYKDMDVDTYRKLVRFKSSTRNGYGYDELYAVSDIMWARELPKQPNEVDMLNLVPYAKSKKYDDYFFWLENYEGVKINYEYLQQDIVDGILYGNVYIDEVLNDYGLIQPIDPADEHFPEDNEWEDVFKNFKKELPFDPNKAEYYDADNQRMNRYWSVGSDSSLNVKGCEVNSPPTPLPQTIGDVQKMFKFINNHGETDFRCGLHVNMSVKGKKLDDIDFLKVMLFMEERLVYDMFDPTREHGGYAESVLTAINRDIKEFPYSAKKLKMNDVFKKFKDKIKVPNDKYFGINISKAMNAGNNARIEFRYMGNDYSSNYQEVIKQIGKYAHYMQLGFDPEYKKREYILKLTRLYNKFYDTKERDIGSYSKADVAKMMTKGMFIGADNFGVCLFLYNKNILYIRPFDQSIVKASTFKEARKMNKFPVLSKQTFYTVFDKIDFIKSQGDVYAGKTKLPLGQELYKDTKGNEYLVNQTYDAITPLTKQNHKRVGKKIIIG